jgi:hypothetical protein
MIHAHQRNAPHKSDSLRRAHAHEKRAYQPGPNGNCNAFNLVQSNPSFFERARQDGTDEFHLLASRNFRHNPSETLVESGR